MELWINRHLDSLLMRTHIWDTFLNGDFAVLTKLKMHLNFDPANLLIRLFSLGLLTWLTWENKMADMKYISLHGYIRNTPSDTEVHGEHQLREDRNTRPAEKDM